MADAIDELFIKLGFDVKDDKIKGVQTTLKGVMKTATMFVTAVIGVTVALDRMANSLARNNQEFINFNRQTGISIANLQKIATAGALVDYNFTPETAMQGIQAVERNLAQIRLGEGNIAPFQILGISPVGKDAIQIIEDLREAIKGIDDMTATNLIQQMGLSPQFLSLLRLSREEMESLQEELMLAPEERQSLQQYSMELKRVHMRFSMLKDRAILPLIPALTRFLNGLSRIIEVLVKLEHWLVDVWNWLGKFKIAVAALAIGIVAYFQPVIAIITAVYLLLEDIAVWATGGKSMLGTTFDVIVDWIKKIFDGIANIFTNVLNWIQQAIDKMMGFFRSVPGWFKGVAGKLGERTFETMTNMNPALQLLSTAGQLANLNNTNTINQNNNFYSETPIAGNLAQKITDLAFAYAQVDRSI